MKVLFITQIVDKEDDILGFVHHWIEKLAPKLEFLNVICLKEGEYNLPSNVKVWSLGKDRGVSKIGRFLRFYKYLLLKPLHYDSVFIHMNPIYAVLGGLYWKARRKKIFLWHNHHYGKLLTRLAILLADRVFYTSPFSFAARFDKSRVMPAGIDAEQFKPQIPASPAGRQNSKARNSILFVGRMSPIKKVDVLIEAVNLLDREGVDFILTIVGEPSLEEKEYFRRVKDLAKKLEAKGKVRFLGKLPNYKTPVVYNQNEIFINLSPSGLFDKAILEAMACQVLTLVSSKAFEKVLPPELIFKESDPNDLKNKIANLLKMSQENKENLGRSLRDYVVQNHSLDILINKLIDEFQKA